MEFYLINILADYGEHGYCFTNQLPKGIGLKSYKLSGGISIAEDYPDDPFVVEVHLGEDYPGLKLPSFVGNTGSMLIVHKDAAGIIKKYDIRETEVLPFSLYDHKNRVYSKDYVILNPLSVFDCTNYECSEIKYTKKGKLLRILKLVLDCKKLRDAPDLFRLKDKPSVYLFSERLIDALKSEHFTNFYFEHVGQE